MPKYGKRTFKKNYRSSRKNSRRIRKKRYGGRGRTLRNFARQLNSVAEKKTFYFGLPNAGDTAAHSMSTDNTAALVGLLGFMNANLLNGTGRSDRIGSKIFIRYFVIKGQWETGTSSNSFAGTCGLWALREKEPADLASATRNNVLGNAPYAYIPDLGTIPYKWIKKKGVGQLCNYPAASASNTPISHWTGGNFCPFKIKIKVFKTFHFLSASDWKISDGMGDYMVIPFLFDNYGFMNGVGPNNTFNVRMSYTDV